MSYKKRQVPSAPTRRRPKTMIEKLKAFLRRFNPHSKVVIIGVFSTIFLVLILVTVRARIGQEQGTRTTNPSPTPRALTPGKDFMQGQINVKFEDGLNDAEINNILLKYNARIKSTISGIGVKVVEVPVGQEDAIIEKLIEEGVVKYAELDRILKIQLAPNDTHYAMQYGLKNAGQSIKGQVGTPNADIKIEPALDVTKGTGIKVAVLDTGLDTAHPEFSGKVVAQKIFITSSIDDMHGHGTHVAGVIAANINNNQGIAGVCPECQLLIGKTMGNDGNSNFSLYASGLTWAADNGAKVINASAGIYESSSVLSDAASYAWNKGSIIVAAAGNDNTTAKFYPGAYPNVVSVAATDNKDQKAPFSNKGDWVDLAAAGRDIYSTVPTHLYALQNSKGTALNYDYFSGTSMATPLVSGVAALIWSTPYGTSNQAVVDRLLNTADPISGTGTYWQKGRVNAAAAVGAAIVTPTISLTPSPTVTQGPTITPSPTLTPSTPTPTRGVTPLPPAPTFVCGGSLSSVCNPTPTPRGNLSTPTPSTTITQGPGLTGTPTITPPVTPDPDDCLDPRSTPERIRDWVRGFLKKINDYIQGVLGNPTDPNRPAPPRPCIVR